ncbi:UNVERIFIED_CONTAM: hypothetical protein GTU68_039024 [Idotea baltica]|nr:hypothetical protein [Idotea baltica]
MIAKHFNLHFNEKPADIWLKEVVRWTWKIKLYTRLETNLFEELREQAEENAINVFALNLHDLLLAAPAGQRTTLALDPGLRTGCKIAITGRTGTVLDTAVIYPHQPKNQWEQSLDTLSSLCKKHSVELVAIGNGTASRESDQLINELIKRFPHYKLSKVMVSEAGASIYSASEAASKELPELDVSLRGAVSIARRLQDPLAELVKIDPKSIGVGQYQHDVSQLKLARSLNAVVEDCVNAVGVDLNTASNALLARISGLNSTLANNIVHYRDTYGAFKSREELKDVPRLGDKTFEQAAGFLRITNGNNPLDASAVHPETYSIVERIAQQTHKNIKELIGDNTFLKSINPSQFVSEQFNLLTIGDILKELEKPGRDPRPNFKTAAFSQGIETLKDLEVSMVLEGVVTNVTNFGAFVDIGVHQDGLVHISSIANKFVKDPHEVVKTGDIVKVKVIDIDIPRKRVALSMRLDDTPETTKNSTHQPTNKNKESLPQKKTILPPKPGAMADLFANAKQLKRKN